VNYVFIKQTECDAREKGQQREGTRRKKPLPTEPKSSPDPDLHHLCFLLHLILSFPIHPFFSCLFYILSFASYIPDWVIQVDWDTFSQHLNGKMRFNQLRLAFFSRLCIYVNQGRFHT